VHLRGSPHPPSFPAGKLKNPEDAVAITCAANCGINNTPTSIKPTLCRHLENASKDNGTARQINAEKLKLKLLFFSAHIITREKYKYFLYKLQLNLFSFFFFGWASGMPQGEKHGGQ